MKADWKILSKSSELIPVRKMLVLWAGGVTIGMKDERGNWRNKVGGYINAPVQAWDYLPEKPDLGDG